MSNDFNKQGRRQIVQAIVVGELSVGEDESHAWFSEVISFDPVTKMAWCATYNEQGELSGDIVYVQLLKDVDVPLRLLATDEEVEAVVNSVFNS